MFGFFKQRSKFREYSQVVDDCLVVLFSGFPTGTLDSIRHTVNLEGAKRGMFKAGEMTAKNGGVALGRTLIASLVATMTDPERESASAALDASSETHPFSIGVAHMIGYAKQLVDDIHGRIIAYEFAGQLRGMSREEIDSWWMKSEVDRITNDIRSSRHGNP